jgi:IclR family transcriptional regulator, KDG regulon repressor
MRILEAIAEKPRSFSELIDLMNSNKATIYRFITTLEDQGYIYKNQNERYQLTLKLYSLGKKEMERYNNLLEVAKPFLVELVNKVNETVVLSSFTNDAVHFLDKIEWNSTLRIVVEPGNSAPLYCVASGKLYLSHFSDEQLDDYFSRQTLSPFTSNTITSIDEMKDEIKKIRSCNFAIDNQEWEEYLRGIAFPIYDYSNKMVAALSISGVSHRFTYEKISSIVDEGTQMASKISGLLGYIKCESEEGTRK